MTSVDLYRVTRMVIKNLLSTLSTNVLKLAFQREEGRIYIVKTISILTTLVKTNHPEPLTLEIPPPLFNIT